MVSPPPLALGVMTRHVARATLADVAEAICGYGLAAVQLNLESAGLEPLPAALDPQECRRIAATLRDAGLAVAAVSGTFNVLDPDRRRLRHHLDRFARLCEVCRLLGSTVIATCTGTRSRESMWTPHPDNRLPDAWDELVERTGEMVRQAAAGGVTMAFEPETANVVDSTARAQQLLEAVRSPHLKVVFDPANFFYPADLPRMRGVLAEGFRRLGGHIALAHAKDVLPPAPGGGHCRYAAAGHGLLDYPTYLRLLRRAGYTGAVILHSLDEAQIPACAAHVRACLERAG